MEEQWCVAESAQRFPSAMIPPHRDQAAHAASHGRLAGTVFTITALLLGYVGLGFVRLLF